MRLKLLVAVNLEILTLAREMAVAKRRRRNNAHQYPKVWEGKAKSSDGFVERGIDPDFEALLAGPYAGLVVEGPPSSTSYVKESLESLESLCVHDVTQPMGDALARTHVTRCLVGEPGATYKYLGLRM